MWPTGVSESTPPWTTLSTRLRGREGGAPTHPPDTVSLARETSTEESMANAGHTRLVSSCGGWCYEPSPDTSSAVSWAHETRRRQSSSPQTRPTGVSESTPPGTTLSTRVRWREGRGTDQARHLRARARQMVRVGANKGQSWQVNICGRRPCERSPDRSYGGPAAGPPFFGQIPT